MNFKKIILIANAALLLGGNTSVRAQCSSSTVGTLETVYSGQQQTYINCDNNGNYILHDVPRKIRTRSCPTCLIGSSGAYITNNASEYTNQNNDTNWDQNDNNYSTFDHALDAHWGAGVVMDYFKTQHCHNSYDGVNNTLGSELLIYLFPNGGSTNEAAWDYSDDFILIEDNNAYPNPTTSLDYIAHEFGHGVNKYIIPGGLRGSNSNSLHWEVKAIDEGLADIWSICVKNYINNHPDYQPMNKDLWLFGSEPYGGIGRPADVWLADYPRNVGSAHQNGNTLTHWFYLVATDYGTISGAQLDQSIRDVSDILYRALSHYAVPEIKFMDLREMTYLAALDLYPVDCPIIDLVLGAWDAVNVTPDQAGAAMLSDIDYAPTFRHTSYDLNGTDYNDTYLYHTTNGLLQALLLENLDPQKVRNVDHLEYIGINSINNTGSFTISESSPEMPVIYTSGQEITLSSDNTKNGLIQAGANCLFRINTCGISPPDHTPPSNCTIIASKPPEEPSTNSWFTSRPTAFTIYPNPSSGSITLNFEGDLKEPARVQIYSLNGQLLDSRENITTNQLEYDLSKYPAGVYTVQLTTQEQTYTHKVVLSH